MSHSMNIPTPKVSGVLKSVSASQVKSFKRCPRLHWLEKRCLIKQPESDAMIIGTKMHEAIEGYFNTSVMFDPATYAPKFQTALYSARMLLQADDAPEPKPGLIIEQPKNYEMGLKAAGINMKGRPDFVDPTNQSTTGRVVNLDWKSSGNMSYAPSSEELRFDDQAIIYATYIFQKYKPDAVVFGHGTCGSKEIAAELTLTDPLTPEFVRGEYAKIEAVVEEMKTHFAIDAFHLTRAEPTLSWDGPCRKYNGCSFASFCGLDLTRKSKTEASPEPSMSSLKERMAARNASITVTPAPVVVAINPPDASAPIAVTPYTPPENLAAEAAGKTWAAAASPIERALEALADARDAITAANNFLKQVG
jgi:hypothetical protein